MAKEAKKKSSATEAKQTGTKQTGKGAASKARGKETPEAKPHRQDGWRETIESIVVAFILAFLFRTFEAEAFVIPTGSMAPTLLGRHKDVTCDECGYKYRVGASFELDEREYLAGRMLHATCPNCRYEMPEETVKHLPVFKGDRILVNKFPFEFTDPDRWDVVVFKYPEHPETNYIKRLVGLPGETIELRHGDVYRENDGLWEILRKDDPDKQNRLQILVFDNDHPAANLHALGWPRRWAAVKNDGAEPGIAGWSEDPAGWQAAAETHSFQLNADQTADGEYRWLRYRHWIPQVSDWRAAASERPLDKPRPELITDFCGYNAASGEGKGPFDEGLYWVGDLTLSGRIQISQLAADGPQELLLELNEGSRKYRCRIDLSTGVATLFFLDRMLNQNEELPLVAGGESTTAETSCRGEGSHRVTFANVDDRLCLWIDGKLVKFNTPTDYLPDDLPLPQTEDLIPVGIAARGATLHVSKLLLERDIYYRGDYLKSEYASGHYSRGYSVGDSNREFTSAPSVLRKLRFDPHEWAKVYSKHLLSRQNVNPADYRFVLDDDEFFMMGDNSPSSLDSRLWRNSRGAKHRYAVPRSALIGRAFFVYWPHGVPFLNDGRGYGIPIPPFNKYSYHQRLHVDPYRNPEVEEKKYPSFTVPFYPQFDRMRRIR